MADLVELRRAVIAGCGGGAMLYDKATALVDELIAAVSANSAQAGSAVAGPADSGMRSDRNGESADSQKMPAIEGVTDRQVVAMIEVLSRQLSEYVSEWERRRMESPPDATHGG